MTLDEIFFKLTEPGGLRDQQAAPNASQISETNHHNLRSVSGVDFPFIGFFHWTPLELDIVS